MILLNGDKFGAPPPEVVKQKSQTSPAQPSMNK
jgi:hypothetical protein